MAASAVVAVSEEGQAYRSPDFDGALPELDEQGQAIREIGEFLEEALVSFALCMDDNPLTQAKALGLAWHCGAQDASSPVIAADFFLRLGESPPDLGISGVSEDQRNKSEAASQVVHYATQLKALDTSSARTVAAYSFDLVRESSGVAEDVSRDAEEAMTSLGEPSWRSIATTGSSRRVASTSGESRRGVAATSVDSDSSFARKQSGIKGLLVAQLEGANFAGRASQMSATIVEEYGPDDPTRLFFNQEVGESMTSALREVQKFVSMRHDGIPPGKGVAIAFEEQYSSKDGPSAAVACALLLDSLITGEKLDEQFAVTGDMNADGSVQPVGGIDGKIRGAAVRECTHVAIPAKSVEIIRDMVVAGELEPLVGIQVFSIETFGDAFALARSPVERDPAIQKAIEEFGEIQEVLLRPNGMRFLENPHVHDRLRNVVAAAPNHESAKGLLLKSLGNEPNTLSLRGSFTEIDRVTRPIMEVLETGDVDNSVNGLKDSMFDLRRVRSKLDERAKPCADSLEDLSRALERLGESSLTPGTAGYRSLVNDVGDAIDRVQAEYNELASDPQIQEELIQ